MSYNHATFGWDRLESFVAGLKAAGLNPVVKETTKFCDRGSALMGDTQALREVYWATTDGTKMVAKEYLAIDDCDCDGTSWVGFVTGPANNCPIPATQVLEA